MRPPLAIAFAHQRPSVSAALDDCFDPRDAAELTIELATLGSSATAGVARRGPDERSVAGLVSSATGER
jgi:hypothetical protein